jgi:FkbM family methyltransferase
MRRIDRLFKILVNNSFTIMGRMDVLRMVWARRQKKRIFRSIRLPVGEIFIDGENAAIDFQVLGQVLLDEVYSEVQLRDKVVVDLGAHKGYFAAFALMAGAKAVFSYEPEPTNFACLCRFADTARLRGKIIEVIQAAAGATDGELTLYMSFESWRHTTIAGQSEVSGRKLQVPCNSLGSILANVRKRFPQESIVLKVDAEGAECAILLHSPKECFTSICEVVFEYHSFAGCSLESISARIGALGFEYAACVKQADLHILHRLDTPARVAATSESVDARKESASSFDA